MDHAMKRAEGCQRLLYDYAHLRSISDISGKRQDPRSQALNELDLLKAAANALFAALRQENLFPLAAWRQGRTSNQHQASLNRARQMFGQRQADAAQTTRNQVNALGTQWDLFWPALVQPEWLIGLYPTTPATQGNGDIDQGRQQILQQRLIPAQG